MLAILGIGFLKNLQTVSLQFGTLRTIRERDKEYNKKRYFQ